jgi:hypothetical protein
MAFLSLVFNPELDPKLIQEKLDIDHPILSETQVSTEEEPLVDQTILDRVKNISKRVAQMLE